MPKQPYYRAALSSLHGPTMVEPFQTLLAQQGVDLVLFHTPGEQMIASAAREPLASIAAFQAATAALVTRALNKEEVVDTIRVGHRVYDVVSIPVYNGSDISGALTLGSEISDDVAEKLSRLTHSQIVLLADDQVIASQFTRPDSKAQFVNLFRRLSSEPGSPDLALRETIIADEHYFYSGGTFRSSTDADAFGYLLFYSSEQALRTLQSTQHALILISGVAILLGSALICFLVGKVTQPLRELRDSAEAVGRGDFSRRVQVRSEDECGELARVFNQMTENLKNSREQLETTVDTLKTTQAQLIQSEKLSGIGEFIAGVAHELNNPLTSVMGFSELLRNTDVDPKYKRYLDMINKCALRCQKIVQALLSFARRRAPERKPVCLNGVLEAALEILQYQLRTSNVEVITRFDSALPLAMIDPHQMQQVFVNILNNARQAIEADKPGGWIRVSTSTREDTIRITFEDSGPGIPPESLSRIFDPFFTTKEVGQGTGLGLSLCYGIIREHGGTITPYSRPGKGATFVIELPVSHEAADLPAGVHSSEPAPPSSQEGQGKRILAIDDEEPILLMMRETLAPHGYEVDVASDGQSGLAQLSRKQYDIVLCDWKMPGLNGGHVYQRLCQTHPHLSSRVIFITGDIVNEKTRAFFEQENRICLAKPFTLAEFHTAVRRVMTSRAARPAGLPEFAK
jgi:signal transduction histidine kinase